MFYLHFPNFLSLMQSLKRAAGGIVLYVNADKTEYKHFNQRGDISSVNNSSIKIMDKFPYLESRVSSIENDIKGEWPSHGLLSIGYRSYGSQVNVIFSKQLLCADYCMDALFGRGHSL